MNGRTWRRVLSAACVAAALVPVRAAGAQEEKGITVKVAGLRVVAPGYGEDMGQLRAFNRPKGVTLALLLLKADGGIVAFEADSSKLDKFGDDKGTDLLAGTEGPGGGFGSWPDVSDDGKACLFEISSETLPDGEATTVSASGTVVLKCGSKKQTFKHDNAPLKKGTKVQAGKIPFEITEVGEPDWGDAEMQITLKATQDLSDVAEIKFLDAAGNEIETSGAGGSSMSWGANIVVEKNFNFPKKLDSVTVAVTYWLDLREVKVPFSLKASAGL